MTATKDAIPSPGVLMPQEALQFEKHIGKKREGETVLKLERLNVPKIS